MKKITIEKGTVQETLMIPLYGRKICNGAFPELYSDPYADELIDKLDYDFSAMEKQSKSAFYKFGALEAAMRQLDIKCEIDDYLKTHPNASIVNMGCGLDQTGRAYLNGKRRIYNVDFPDIIGAREKLTEPVENEINIASDINNLEWTQQIDAQNGVILFAAGVMHYFTKEQVRGIIEKFSGVFRGGRFVFDAVGKFGRDVAMKKTLQTLGMKDVSGYFCVSNPEKDLADLPKNIHVSSKGYMCGYYNLKDYNISALHRFLSRIGDGVMKMRIYRLDITEGNDESEKY